MVKHQLTAVCKNTLDQLEPSTNTSIFP